MLFLRTLIACTAWLLLFAATSIAQAITAPTFEVALTSRDARGIFIPAGSSTESLPFLADPQSGGGDFFDVITSSPDIKISLILPNGTEVNASNAQSLGFLYEVLPDGSMSSSTIPSIFSTAGAHTLRTYAKSEKEQRIAQITQMYCLPSVSSVSSVVSNISFA